MAPLLLPRALWKTNWLEILGALASHWFCLGLMYDFSQALVLSWWSYLTCDPTLPVINLTT